jgi:hypothetical protein
MSTLKSINVIHPSSAVNNIVNDASGNVAVGNNLTVAGTSSFTGTLGNITTGTISSGNITSSGTVAATTGTLYPIVSGTAQASTSGTTIDFTSIPSWVKRVTVMMNGVSTSGTSGMLLQIGAGSVTVTGYSSIVGVTTTSGSAGGGTSTSAFYLSPNITAATTLIGSVIISLLGSNTWVCQGVTYSRGDSANYPTGSVTLSGALDRVRITTVGGTDTFDAGSINILYE